MIAEALTFIAIATRICKATVHAADPYRQTIALWHFSALHD